jgi:CrcB protein
MMPYLWIAIGSGLGGAARVWCAGVVTQFFGQAFPWGILFVNATGSFAIGMFSVFTIFRAHLSVSLATRHFLMAGLCGGYTTFSAFSLDTFTLLRDGRVLAACANVGLSVGLCLMLVWLGHALAVRLKRFGSRQPH